ncbi:prepilin-type N-terminal cleavage/methylation domain-containing protein [Paenisporosarcina macmurdoensis]|uniref:Prepilin-type N-terminal cleavage/methylation domain-containing protein n=1 Tax=Paenisporosarcina macmurdoensis TaxID=212659 RepID=A0ABW1L1T9_9BACL
MQETPNIQNGMTLVEILAAILIMSLVLITFMALFIQSAKYTAHNRETLTSVEIAENIIGKVRLSDDLTGLGLLKKENIEVTAKDAFNDVDDVDDKIEVVNGGDSNYNVFLTIVNSKVKLPTLKRIKVEVNSKNPSVKNSKPFETEIFIEVSS